MTKIGKLALSDLSKITVLSALARGHLGEYFILPQTLGRDKEPSAIAEEATELMMI